MDNELRQSVRYGNTEKARAALTRSGVKPLAANIQALRDIRATWPRDTPPWPEGHGARRGFDFYCCGLYIDERLPVFVRRMFPMTVASDLLERFNNPESRVRMGAWEAIQRDPMLKPMFTRTLGPGY